MPIGEFIDNITPIELQKFEIRDPIKRLIGGGDDKSHIDESMMDDTISINKSMGKSMKRLNSKSTVRTSAAKTPSKRRPRGERD